MQKSELSSIFEVKRIQSFKIKAVTVADKLNFFNILPLLNSRLFELVPEKNGKKLNQYFPLKP